MDAFFYEAFEEEQQQLKKYMPSVIEAGYDWRSVQESAHRTPPARIISVRTQSEIPLQWREDLDALLTRSTGYDHITEYNDRCERPLPAGYLPLYCHRSVAEQALTLFMALLRRLKNQTDQFDSFQRDGLTGGECQGRTLLVVGVGNIGYEMVSIGQGLGMHVLGVDIEQKHDDVFYVDIEEGLSRADIIVCAMSLNADNYHYFDKARWAKVKQGAIFINVARGEMAPINDMAEALDEGLLSGVGVDVYEREGDLAHALRAGRPKDFPQWQRLKDLKERFNVIFTPHNAFNTLESVQRKSRQSAEQIVSFLEKRQFKWPIPYQKKSS